MNSVLSNISTRSLPACCRVTRLISSRFVHAVPISSLRLPASSTSSDMLGRANKQFEASASQSRPATSGPVPKPFLPPTSQSPKSDIREQFRRPTAFAVSASATARTGPHTKAQPLHDLPVSYPNIGQSSVSTRTGMASLYGGHSKSFDSNTSVVDLTTGSSGQQGVFFEEDDFSDDENLDLDFEAPAALPPAQPAKAPATPASAKPQPPPSSAHTIPWSSSPAHHHLPPKVARQESGASSVSSHSLKREIAGDGQVDDDCFEVERFDAPPAKKAKKRTLPASFRGQSLPKEDDQAMKTPAAKSRGYWDPSASAVKEQKNKLKRQGSLQPKIEKLEDAKQKFAHPDDEGQGQSKKSDAIQLSSEQEKVIDLVCNQDRSVFFTGPAGTGKSVLMRAIIKKMKAKYARTPQRLGVTASTGLAACNIDGQTLHSFAGIGLGKESAPELVKKIRRNQKAKERWMKVKTLIIDEISMVDGELFDKLSQIGMTLRNNGRPWGGIQIIITGDFFQLPPVPDGGNRNVKFAFDANTWITSIDHTIGLTQVFRQRDPEFAHMLNEMRLGRISDDTVKAFKALSRPLKFDDGVDLAELFPTRHQVDQANMQRMQALPGKSHRFEAADIGKEELKEKLLQNVMAPKVLDLKINAQVMLIKNLDDTLVNGSLGKVIGFSDEKTFDMDQGYTSDGEDDKMAKARAKLAAFSNKNGEGASSQKFPVVQFTSTRGANRIILCQPEEWKVEAPNGEVQAKRTQLPLILAWALSIHKAQGQTLERVTVNLGKIFEKGQAYVALSRATSQDGLRVLGFDKSKVMAHPDVIKFYGKLYSAQDAAAQTTRFERGSNSRQVVAKSGRIKFIGEDDEVMSMASGH